MLAVRIVLRGDCQDHAELARLPEATLQQLRAAAVEVAGPEELWVEDVRIETGPALDLAAMRAQPGAVGALVAALEQPLAVEAGLRAFAADQLGRARGVLEAEHPVHAIAAGRVPADVLERARALVLAELARR